MSKAKPLDPPTLRRVAVQMRKRGNRLRHGIQYGDITWGRAVELDLQADNLLTEARALESRRKSRKA